MDEHFEFTCLDHRTFGESEGRPRQFENPAVKIADIRAAVAALRVGPSTRTLPLAAVGVCAGAGYMARAVAEEKTFTAFAGVAGYYAEVTEASLKSAAARIERGRAAERAWRETGVAETIPGPSPVVAILVQPVSPTTAFGYTLRWQSRIVSDLARLAELVVECRIRRCCS